MNKENKTVIVARSRCVCVCTHVCVCSILLDAQKKIFPEVGKIKNQPHKDLKEVNSRKRI